MIIGKSRFRRPSDDPPFLMSRKPQLFWAVAKSVLIRTSSAVFRSLESDDTSAMLKRCAPLLYLAAAMVNGQSRTDLLRRAAEFYRNLNSFDVKGVASARVPNSSWQ